MAFVKGRSGNPGGRKPLPLDVVKLCREATPEAVERLVSIVRDTKAPPAAAVRAAEVLMNRGWGTASQTVRLEGEMEHHVKRIIIEE
jgi:hypothetical protein